MQNNNQGNQDDSEELEIIYTANEAYLEEKSKKNQENIPAKPAAAVAAISKEQIAQQRDEKHLKFLNLIVDNEMEGRKAEVLDGETQTDWFIFESHAYNVKSWKYESNVILVSRRFSDFEWLREDLLFNYPGYVLPPLSQKGLFSKLDPKISYLNQKKQELMEERRQFLQNFLQKLLSHRELKFAPQLSAFLKSSDASFTQIKNSSKESQEEKKEPKEGLFKSIMNKGFTIFSKAVGSSKIEKRAPDEHDEYFRIVTEQFSKQYSKLKELWSCVNLVFEAKKEQAENLSIISTVFSQLKQENQEGQQNNPDKIIMKAGQIEVEQTQKLFTLIDLPLKQSVEQLEACLEILASREAMAQKVFLLQKELSSLGDQNQEGYSEIQSKLEYEKKRLKIFLVNYRQNENLFSIEFNKKISEITSLFESTQLSNNQELLELWKQYENNKVD